MYAPRNPGLIEKVSPCRLAAFPNVLALEREAIAALPKSASLYIGTGAEAQETLRANRAGWDRYALRPRIAVGR
eukprot:SAG31_NODE_136_length_23089_cov_8.825924_23_plen_74_part_00